MFPLLIPNTLRKPPHHYQNFNCKQNRIIVAFRETNITAVFFIEYTIECIICIAMELADEFADSGVVKP
jgi:hypothetical protein